MAMEQEFIDWVKRKLFTSEWWATAWMIIIAVAMVQTLNTHFRRRFWSRQRWFTLCCSQTAMLRWADTPTVNNRLIYSAGYTVLRSFGGRSTVFLFFSRWLQRRLHLAERHLFSTESLATTWMVIVAAAMVDTSMASWCSRLIYSAGYTVLRSFGGSFNYAVFLFFSHWLQRRLHLAALYL